MVKDRGPEKEGPYCKVCEAHHWSYQPHVFTDGKNEKKPVVGVAVDVKPEVTVSACAVAGKPTAGMTRQEAWKKRNIDKWRQHRREYMREYRKRRAGGKS